MSIFSLKLLQNNPKRRKFLIGAKSTHSYFSSSRSRPFLIQKCLSFWSVRLFSQSSLLVSRKWGKLCILFHEKTFNIYTWRRKEKSLYLKNTRKFYGFDLTRILFKVPTNSRCNYVPYDDFAWHFTTSNSEQ